MFDQQFELLRHASSDQERNWLLTRFNLESLDADLVDAVLRAAIPHWFDVPILAAILEIDAAQAEDMLRRIFALPFAEKYSDIGYTIHDQTREAILWHLVTTKNPVLQETARRGAEYFQKSDDPQYRVEHVYLYLMSQQEDGVRNFKKQEAFLRNKEFFSAAEHLIKQVKDLMMLGVVEQTELNIEIERQLYLIGSSRADVIRNRNSEEILEEHWLEIFRILGHKRPFFDKKSAFEVLNEGQKFERTYLMQKIENAQLKGDIKELSMWKIELAKSYRLDEEYGRSLEIINSVFELTNGSKQAYAHRGITYRMMGNYKLAIKDLSYAIELDDTYETAYANRGVSFAQLGIYKKAIPDLTRAFDLDETYTWAIASRAETYRLMKKYALAIDDFTRAIMIKNKYSWAFAHRGAAYYSMKKYEMSINDFTCAISLDAKYSWAFACRGEAYHSIQQYEQAISDFTNAIQIDEKYKWAITHRGESYRAMKRYKEAIEDYNRAIQLDNLYIWAIQRRSWIYFLTGKIHLFLREFGRFYIVLIILLLRSIGEGVRNLFRNKK